MDVGDYIVSLFTREWIEIFPACQHDRGYVRSPSLRGSGLKFSHSCKKPEIVSRLPLYEGVD